VKRARDIMKSADMSNETLVNLYTQRLDAMRKYFSGRRCQIPAGGRMVKLTDVVRAFEIHLWRRAAVTAAHAAYKTALAERDEDEAAVRLIDDAMKGWVRHRFGGDSDEARDFGYSPRKKPVGRAVAPIEDAPVEATPAVNAPAAGGDA